jgi:antibiotic biosynthesis monooxygenase (ABM) superfamily enzyme
VNTKGKAIEPVTIVLSEIVQPNQINEYEQWVSGINKAVSEFPGFEGVDIIRPRDPQHPEYVVIVRFKTSGNLKFWQESAVYRSWIKKSDEIVTRESHTSAASGLEMWFTLGNNIHPRSKPPAYYKLVILGILAVYPLVLFTNYLLDPVLRNVPYLFGVFLSVVAICLLMTYPVLPWLERILNSWLYPSSNKRH